jgi:uncharacterized protein involved in outer membrane biogenesis
MSRRTKIVLGILIGLIVIVVALVVIVPQLIDVDRYRPQVASLIEKETGKPAQIGHLALTVFPTLSIRVDDFALSNPAGFPQGYFVKAQRIYAVINAGGLWKHQVVIKSLDLDAPTISLLSDIKGNWNFESKPSSTNSTPDPPGEKPLFTLGVISNVKISKGTLSVSNLLPSGQPGPVFFEADGISSQLQQVNLSAFTESASLRPAQPASGMLNNPAGMSFRGVRQPTDDEESRPDQIGASRTRFLAPSWTGQSGASLGMTAPTKISPRPAEGAAAVFESGWLTTVAYAADQSATLVAAGTLDMDSLHVMNLVVTNVKSKLRLFSKQIFFDGLDFKCYDGHAQADISFAFAGQNPHYDTNTNLSGVNVAKLLDSFPDSRGKMTGTLDGSVKLDGEVSHSTDPLAGVRGSGQMTIRKGSLPSLQLNKNLLQLAQLAQMGPASGDPSSFSSISLDFTIANDRINTSKATIVGNGLNVDASGSLGLAGEGSLDYQGVAEVAANSKNPLTSIVGSIAGATVANGKMAFPFNLTGTLQKPNFALKSGGAGSRLGAVGQQPANVVKGLGGLFGKKSH